METYFFTFGQVHETKEGIPMKDYYVEVEAEDYNSARDTFVKEFSSVNMDHPDRWAFQYERRSFIKEYYPKGLFIKIVQSKQ